MMTSVVKFMMRLRKIDNAGLVARDIVIMWAIQQQPGMMGTELGAKLGFKHRSNVQFGIRRLEGCGMIEDRRIKLSKLTPNNLHLTPAGLAFLTDLTAED